MMRDNKLFLVQWRSHSPEDDSPHHFLLFAPDWATAPTLVAQILGARGRICAIEELGPQKHLGATAAIR